MAQQAGTRVLAVVRKAWLKQGAEGRVIAAVSGGVDSMTLLEAIARVARGTERWRVLVLHVNHALRGEESDGDEALVRARAEALGFPIRVERLAWGAELPSQDAARRRRDSLYRELCPGRADRVWLAHHLNDQAETVFLRLLRGTGAKGLRGMLPENGVKVRPFLALEKAELRAAAEAWGVPWREDRTNADPDAYERNWLRSFFPQLEGRRPGFQRRLAALAAEARHWPLPPPLADRFEAAPGVVFARPGRAPGTAALAEAFGLRRLHAEELAALLGRASGALQAERARFTWSRGVLLHERAGCRYRSELARSGAGVYESGLGRWELPPRAAPLGEPEKGGAGERRKKEFQALGVPLFFRAGIPLVELGGRPVALLPRRLERLSAGVRFTPSPLGAWWLGHLISTDP